MLKKRFHRYRYLKQYCLRTPIYPLSFYTDLTSKAEISYDMLLEIWKDKVVREAIYLAAPALFYELEKSFNNPMNNSIKDIHLSLLKYISRMASRCTPFGLFAGCEIGSIANNTNIQLHKVSSFKRQTRFDMNFLVAFSKKLSQQENIKNQILFHPNTSLYKAGKHLRYIEYTLLKKQRVYSIEAVKNTDYLQKVLQKAKDGKSIIELASIIVDEQINLKEATVFIEELIINQLLVSELEPTLSGVDYLELLIARLKCLKDTPKLSKFVSLLNNIDSKIGNPYTVYKNIHTNLKSLGIHFEEKYLFQTDLFIASKKNQLNKQTIHKVKEGFLFLNKITPKETKIALNAFKKAFVKRYETRETPLVEALDIEMGIGYIQNQEGDNTPIFDDLVLSSKITNQEKIVISPFQKIVYQKLHKNRTNTTYTIPFFDCEIEHFTENWQDLPDTLATMVELVSIKNEEFIFMDSVGGSSAANLLGRFGLGDTDIHQYAQKSIDHETALQKDKILAEIIHLPEARTGNILRRPTFREYEIPYLGKATVDNEKQLPIQDLMLSVKGDHIMLRSKKHNKEVLPRLTNAHNFSRNALPIYHLLCDLQTQNLRSNNYFSWGNLAMNYPFLPRLTYKNIIFSKARWLLQKKDIEHLLVDFRNSKTFLQTVKEWRQSFYSDFEIPQFVQLVDGDNTLLVNLENTQSVKMLLKTVRKRNSFKLQEFLFNEEGVVKTDKGKSTNQFIFSFYKMNDK